MPDVLHSRFRFLLFVRVLYPERFENIFIEKAVDALHLFAARVQSLILREVVQARFGAQRLLRVKFPYPVRRKSVVVHLIGADITEQYAVQLFREIQEKGIVPAQRLLLVVDFIKNPGRYQIRRLLKGKARHDDLRRRHLLDHYRIAQLLVGRP